MAPVHVHLRVTKRWWFTPYYWLTAFGLWIGLPLNPDVIVRDLMRGVKVEVESCKT